MSEAPTPDERPLEGTLPQASVLALKKELARQRHLIEASYALHTTLDLDELLKIILDAASNGVSADRGTVFLMSADRKELWSKVLQGDQDLMIRLPVGKGIAGTVGETGDVINIIDAHEDERFDASWDRKTGFRTRQILCAPIRRRDGEIVGVFQLLNKKEGDFDADDEAFLAALSVHAALAIENARLHSSAIEKERQDREIALLQGVQRAFQPERSDRVMGGIIAAGMNELCEDASGDYYDFIDLPSGRLAAVIGDVSGHGLRSALVMAQARAMLRAFAATVDGLANVMNMLNDFLVEDMTRGNFMCMFIALFEPETGKLRWCNAGHPPGILLRAKTGEVERLPATGRVLGILPGANYQAGTDYILEPGDSLLLYTDGATEATAPDGEMFEEERLTATFKEHITAGPQAVLEGVRKALLKWTREPRLDDDLTLLVVQRS